MRTRQLPLLALSLALALLAGCRTYPDYTGDFRFPILRGDISQGQQAFVQLECNRCHLVEGVELPAPAQQRMLTVPLGGELIFAKTYADLVTSIINPDHVISERYLDQLPRETARRLQASPMPYYGEMTINDLVDVVAFLNSRYSLLPGYTEYFY